MSTSWPGKTDNWQNVLCSYDPICAQIMVITWRRIYADVIFSKLRPLYVWISYYKYDFRLCDSRKICFQTRQFGYQWSCQNTYWVQLGHVSSAGDQLIEYKPRDTNHANSLEIKVELTHANFTKKYLIITSAKLLQQKLNVIFIIIFSDVHLQISPFKWFKLSIFCDNHHHDRLLMFIFNTHHHISGLNIN